MLSLVIWDLSDLIIDLFDHIVLFLISCCKRTTEFSVFDKKKLSNKVFGFFLQRLKIRLIVSFIRVFVLKRFDISNNVG